MLRTGCRMGRVGHRPLQRSSPTLELPTARHTVFPGRTGGPIGQTTVALLEHQSHTGPRVVTRWGSTDRLAATTRVGQLLQPGLLRRAQRRHSPADDARFGSSTPPTSDRECDRVAPTRCPSLRWKRAFSKSDTPLRKGIFDLRHTQLDKLIGGSVLSSPDDARVTKPTHPTDIRPSRPVISD
jgi:hypothetical protein